MSPYRQSDPPRGTGVSPWLNDDRRAPGDKRGPSAREAAADAKAPRQTVESPTPAQAAGKAAGDAAQRAQQEAPPPPGDTAPKPDAGAPGGTTYDGAGGYKYEVANGKLYIVQSPQHAGETVRIPVSTHNPAYAAIRAEIAPKGAQLAPPSSGGGGGGGDRPWRGTGQKWGDNNDDPAGLFATQKGFDDWSLGHPDAKPPRGTEANPPGPDWLQGPPKAEWETLSRPDGDRPPTDPFGRTGGVTEPETVHTMPAVVPDIGKLHQQAASNASQYPILATLSTPLLTPERYRSLFESFFTDPPGNRAEVENRIAYFIPAAGYDRHLMSEVYNAYISPTRADGLASAYHYWPASSRFSPENGAARMGFPLPPVPEERSPYVPPRTRVSP